MSQKQKNQSITWKDYTAPVYEVGNLLVDSMVSNTDKMVSKAEKEYLQDLDTKSKLVKKVKVPYSTQPINDAIALLDRLYKEGLLGTNRKEAVDGHVGSKTRKAQNISLLRLLIKLGLLDNSKGNADDGIMGKNSNNALAEALKQGYILKNGILSKKDSSKASIADIFSSIGSKISSTVSGWVDLESPKTIKPNKPIKLTNGSVYYVNYPNYKISSKGAFPGKLGQAIDKLGTFHMPLGHAGVLTVDLNGNTEYYDYGRYHSNIYGKNSDGNFRKIAVPNYKGLEASEYIKTLSKILGGHTIELVGMEGADSNKVKDFIRNKAFDKNREEYSCIGNSCATNAYDAVKAGFNDSYFETSDGIMSFTPSQYAEVLEKKGFKKYK